MIKCKKCRKEMRDDFKFCPWCGKEIEKKPHKRADGLYERVVTVNGKRKTFYAKTLKELEKKIRTYEWAKEEQSSVSFKSIAENWEKEAYESLSNGSIKAYKPRAKRAVEHFDDTPIASITVQDVNRYIKQFPKSWAFKTANAHLSVLSLIFSYACRCEVISSNPCQFAKLPKNLKKTHRRAPTQAEIDIIKNSVNIEGGLMAFFFLYTGLRRGEALALTWNDIDFENKTIRVNKSVHYIGNNPHIKSPKTENGNRTIFLLDTLAEKLKLLKKKTHELVFSDNGELFTAKRFETYWQHYQDVTGLDEVTPHIARHGFASICFEAELEIKDVQEIMGHAQYSTTSDIYTHISDKRREKSFEKLNTFVNNS